MSICPYARNQHGIPQSHLKVWIPLVFPYNSAYCLYLHMYHIIRFWYILFAVSTVQKDAKRVKNKNKFSNRLFKTSTSTINKNESRNNPIVKNITVNIFESTKFSRVFEFKALKQIQPHGNSIPTFSFKTKLIDIQVTVLRHRKKYSR